LIHLKPFTIKLVISTRFVAISTPSSGISVLKYVSEHDVSCHALSLCLLTSLKKEVPDDGVEEAPKLVEVTTVFKCI
jgi:hypothetical protein